MPAIAIPDVAADSGLARVIIPTDLPASVFTVSTVLTRRGPRTARTLVCSETPCVLTLPYGDHELELTALDVLERNSTVITVLTRRGPRTARTLVCSETPCVLTLPYGDHELELTALDVLERNSTVIAHVNASTVVLNHTLGRVHAPGGQAAGITLVVLGVLGLAVGLGAAASESKSSGTSTDGTTAAAVGLVGFGVIALAAALAAANPPVEQPGTTREWSPAPARVAGGSFGLRF